MVLEWPIEYVLAKQMSTVGLVSGLELNQINAKVALKVLCIEQLGLPSWIRTFGLIEHSAILFI